MSSLDYQLQVSEMNLEFLQLHLAGDYILDSSRSYKI